VSSQLLRSWKCLEVLGTTGAPHKCFEAFPASTASSKHAEARRITANFFLPHWLAPRASGLDGMDDTRG